MVNMDLNSPHSMETTIISVTFDGGVVLGADSRTSTGAYVANRASDNITKLTDKAADSQDMLQTGLIVGGWSKHEGVKIFSIPLGGTIIEQPFAIGGSGSSYLYGFFDQAWKEVITKEEAEALVVKAVSLAIARDGASGGVGRIVTIDKDGSEWKFYSGNKLQLWHEELEPQNSLLDIWGATDDIPEPMRE